MTLPVSFVKRLKSANSKKKHNERCPCNKLYTIKTNIKCYRRL